MAGGAAIGADRCPKGQRPLWRPIRVTVWGENVHENRESQVRAIYPAGMHETIAAALGARDVAVGADVAAMLDAVRPDFLVNVSPPAAHHAITRAALERGVHVLSEKPMWRRRSRRRRT
jgi:predicted dehydrogenase